MKNLLIVVSGPSGVGKGTIVKELLAKGGYALSVSCTTRAPREREVDGVSYYFISREKFENLIKEGGFLEYSNHFGCYYGTPKAFVEQQLEKHDVLLEIDVDGALNVKRVYPEALLIMILPPDRQELKNRLVNRGTEDEKTIERRLERMDYELSKKHYYDYAVVNDKVDRAVAEIESIISGAKKKL